MCDDWQECQVEGCPSKDTNGVREISDASQRTRNNKDVKTRQMWDEMRRGTRKASNMGLDCCQVVERTEVHADGKSADCCHSKVGHGGLLYHSYVASSIYK